MQLFNFKNFIFLQGNLPLEFKEGGTLLGRFWRGIWNWEDCFWLEDLKKEKRRRKEIGEFSFFGNKFRSWGVIYIGEKRKRRGGAVRIGVLGEKFWGFLGVKDRGNGKRAIATKVIQVCFSLLLEFLPIFDFSACLFLNIYCIVDFVWTERATNCFGWYWLLICLPQTCCDLSH